MHSILIKKKKMKNVINVSLEKLANISDVISIHIHLSKATINFIDHSFLNKMKKNAILINTSRGKIVNEEALLSALKEKVIAGAGLDVIDGEWLSKAQIKNHALIKYSNMNDNLVITPHIGGSTTESIKNARVFMAKKVANELKKYKKS